MSNGSGHGRRVLLDEMLPRVLTRELPLHQVTTVAEEGWSGVLNGELLRRMDESGIEVFVTADRNMQYQQRLAGRNFGVVVIAAGGTRVDTLQAVASELQTAVASVVRGEVRYVSKPA